MKLNEAMIGDFTALGREVEHEGKTVRPEIQVSVAVGSVSKIEEAGKDLLRVSVRPSGAKFDYAGYINSSDPVAELYRQAEKKGVPVGIRLEQKRKPKIDPTIPLAELKKDMNTARENTVKVIGGIFNFNSEEWVLSRESQTVASEDPTFVLPKLLSCIVGNTENFFEAPKANVKVQGSADDKANQLISMYYYISERAKEYDFELAEEKLFVVAKQLLRLCDMLQTAVYKLDAPNYRDYSHTRARFMLFSWERLHPLNKEALENFKDWGKRFVTENHKLWVWAISESTPERTSDQ